MLKNYLKIAWRNLTQNKSFAFINIGGLAVGIACCLLIFLYIQDELSYDEFQANSNRIYRILREFDMPDLHSTIAHTPSSLGLALQKNATAVKKAVRINDVAAPMVEKGTKKFVETGFAWASNGFFKIFSFPIIQGKAALKRPGTVVLSEKMAQKYFPNTNPIGKTLHANEFTLEVTGVMKNMPENSSLQYNFIGSLQTLKPPASWDANNYLTFVMLKEGIAKSTARAQINKIISANMPSEIGDHFIPHLQPLTGIHLGFEAPEDIPSPGNPLYLWLFGAMAIFVLLLACINFTNMSTARSMERAREVGMLKTLGAQGSQLAGQFLGEATLLSIAAIILAVGLTRLGLPLLNSLSGKSLSLAPLFIVPYVFVLLGLPLLVGLIAGSYPAIVLSGYKPLDVMRGSFSTGRGGRRLRRVLVIFQFAVSVIILIGTLVVYQQLRFMQSAELGFNKENVVVIDHAGRLGKSVETFMQELEQLPGVKQAGSAYSVPGTFFLNGMWMSSEPNAEPRNMNYSFVGEDYIETLGIEMVAGQDFGPKTPDRLAVMLNEAAAHEYGWTPQEAIQKSIQRGRTEFKVVGVMKNFHYKSLQQKIYPLMLFPGFLRQDLVIVRIKSRKVSSTLPAIRSIWKKFSALPPEYSFLADGLVEQYKTEARLATVLIAFAALAIFIACIGLFSLAAYSAERRIKEIGIRKALGATTAGIWGLLSKDFLKLVLIGFVIAVPVAWYFMRQWLQDFAYRIDLGVGVFLLAGGLALLIALATISWQSIQAALTNPVNSLKNE